MCRAAARATPTAEPHTKVGGCPHPLTGQDTELWCQDSQAHEGKPSTQHGRLAAQDLRAPVKVRLRRRVGAEDPVSPSEGLLRLEGGGRGPASKRQSRGRFGRRLVARAGACRPQHDSTTAPSTTANGSPALPEPALEEPEIRTASGQAGPAKTPVDRTLPARTPIRLTPDTQGGCAAQGPSGGRESRGPAFRALGWAQVIHANRRRSPRPLDAKGRPSLP
jgi:hypothetical protein